MLYVISPDRVFANMLVLALGDRGIKALYSPVAQKNCTGAAVDLDAPAISSGAETLTFSRDPEKHPDLIRPFPVSDFCQAFAEKFISTERRDAPLVISADEKGAYYGTEKIAFTEKELALFRLLYERRGTPVSREEIERVVWHGDVTGNTAEVYINYLRKKTDGRFGTRSILTVRGKGYMLSAKTSSPGGGLA